MKLLIKNILVGIAVIPPILSYYNIVCKCFMW